MVFPNAFMPMVSTIGPIHRQCSMPPWSLVVKSMDSMVSDIGIQIGAAICAIPTTVALVIAINSGGAHAVTPRAIFRKGFPTELSAVPTWNPPVTAPPTCPRTVAYCGANPQ